MSSIAPGGSPQPSRVFRRWDREISAWMYDNGRLLLRLALAIIFIWFGALKIFQASPADDLIKRTVYWLRPAIRHRSKPESAPVGWTLRWIRRRAMLRASRASGAQAPPV
jgi:hypothetical protein